jgi:ribose transport system substrate-binding protein
MKKFKKLITTLVLLGLFVVALSACAPAAEEAAEAEVVGEAAESEAGEVGEILVGCTMMDETNPFFVAICDTVEEEVAARGGKVVRIDGAADQVTQNNGIEDMISKGIDALVLAPVDVEGIAPSLDALAAAGIPVFNVDTAVGDLSKVVSFISANNYQAGYILGEEMIRVFPDGANLAILDAPMAESVVQRVNGILGAIEGSNIVVVEQQSVQGIDTILSQAEDILMAHPDLDAFYGVNDPGSMVVAGVVDAAGKKDQVKVFGVDGAPAGKQGVKDGSLAATSAQSPVGQAKLAVEYIYKYLAGEEVPATSPMDTVLINADNVDEFDVENWE